MYIVSSNALQPSPQYAFLPAINIRAEVFPSTIALPRCSAVTPEKKNHPPLIYL